MNGDEAREYAELTDDVQAASEARARIADGRRIEMTVEELATLIRPDAPRERSSEFRGAAQVLVSGNPGGLRRVAGGPGWPG
ncbi:hypothetical protein ACWDR0_07805 [Streptomyces sp. NPDC003691]